MTHYVPRHLTWFDSEGRSVRVEEHALSREPVPLVVLGDPGIGKTELLLKLSEAAGYRYLTAARFLRLPPDPSWKGVLLLDALDEVSAGKDNDPLDRVLAKLGEAGWPDFVLSCRAADWRGSARTRAISDDYERPVRVLTLQALSENEGRALLDDKIGPTAAQSFLEALHSHHLTALLNNPQSLQMLLEVAEAGIPDSRADLFHRATVRMIEEHNDEHVQSNLNRLTPDAILDGAGAAMAMLLLAGKEGLHTGLRNRTPSELEHISHISSLPLAKHCLTALKSRLFRATGGDDSFKDCHRTVAEYLGARWLARVVDLADDPERMVKRILALIRSGGRVPASLRGLHAWLAHHSRHFQSPVITTDPYGVLRYGDLGNIPLGTAELVWDSFRRHGEQDPWFRAGDWQRYQVEGLVQRGLGEKLSKLLDDPNSSFHLRSLMLELLRGGACVPEMADTLLGIIQNPARAYSERHHATLILADLPDNGIDWADLLLTLCRKGDNDAARLAEESIGDLGIDLFSDEQIAEIAFAQCGGYSTEEKHRRRDRFDTFWSLKEAIPAERCAGILDKLADRFEPGTDAAGLVQYDRGFGTLAHALIARRIPIGETDARRLWRWLEAFAECPERERDARATIADWLAGNTPVRQSIQEMLFLTEDGLRAQKGRYWNVGQLSIGLYLQEDDVLRLLSSLESFEHDAPIAREAFEMLARRWNIAAQTTAEIIEALERAAAGNPERLAILHPPPPPPIDPEHRRWETSMVARERRHAIKLEKQKAEDRAAVLRDSETLRQGGGPIGVVALHFLGEGNVVGRDNTPEERIGNWIGEDLYPVALDGFEAALHRPLDTTPAEITGRLIHKKGGHDPIWGLVAGLAQRHRDGRGFKGLSEDHLIAGLIAKQIGLHIVDKHLERYGDALLEFVLADPLRFERFLRALIEPQLATQRHYICGTHFLLSGKDHRNLRARLLLEWFEVLNNQTATDQVALVDALLDVPAEFREQANRHVDAMIALAPPRPGGADQTEHWTALKLLRDFDDSLPELEAASENRDFLWALGKATGHSRFGDRPTRQVPHARLIWIFDRFEKQWPETDRPSGSTEGSRHPWDASDFLQSLLFHIAEDSSPEAMRMLHQLAERGSDTYGEALRAARSRQRAKAAETEYVVPSGEAVGAALREQAPRSAAEIKTVVLDGIDRVQRRLRGSATDPIDLFFDPDGPKDEERCRNALLDLLEASLPFGIVRAAEERMPNGKRCDAGFRLGEMRVPLEAKLVWNSALWTAPAEQLDRLYASSDHMADGHGIYLVFWFGRRATTGRAIPRGPGGKTPDSPEALKVMLEGQLFAGAEERLSIVVLDVSRR